MPCDNCGQIPQIYSDLRYKLASAWRIKCCWLTPVHDTPDQAIATWNGHNRARALARACSRFVGRVRVLPDDFNSGQWVAIHTHNRITTSANGSTHMDALIALGDLLAILKEEEHGDG